MDSACTQGFISGLLGLLPLVFISAKVSDFPSLRYAKTVMVFLFKLCCSSSVMFTHTRLNWRYLGIIGNILHGFGVSASWHGSKPCLNKKLKQGIHFCTHQRVVPSMISKRDSVFSLSQLISTYTY